MRRVWGWGLFACASMARTVALGSTQWLKSTPCHGIIESPPISLEEWRRLPPHDPRYPQAILYTATGAPMETHRLTLTQSEDNDDNTPFVALIPGFASAMECAAIQRAADTRKWRSIHSVVKTKAEYWSEKVRHRLFGLRNFSSQQLLLYDDLRNCLEFELLVKRVNHLLPIPIFSASVKRYFPGTVGINEHCDLSYYTVIVYLTNTDGGSTDFTRLGITVRPEIGTALVFRTPTLSEGPELDKFGKDRRLNHCGRPIASGTKYIVQFQTL